MITRLSLQNFVAIHSIPLEIFQFGSKQLCHPLGHTASIYIKENRIHIHSNHLVDRAAWTGKTDFEFISFLPSKSYFTSSYFEVAMVLLSAPPNIKIYGNAISCLAFAAGYITASEAN